MRRFVFGLDALHEHRQRAEETSQRGFAEADRALREAEARLAETARVYGDAGREIDELKENGASAHDLQMHQAYLAGLKRQIAAHKAAVAERARLLEKKRAELVEASRNRKVTETIKERSLEAHVACENRREQKEADELTSARLRRKDDAT